MDRMTYAEINLTNLTDNVKKIVNKFDSYNYYFGVVKADCYGHGDIKTVQAIIDGGCNYLAVATLDEALFIRNHIKDIPILLLGVVKATNIKDCIENNITITLNSLILLNELLEVNTDNLKIHIKINTGAARLGFGNKEELKIAVDNLKNTNIFIEGIFTHIYNADNKEDTNSQLKLFNEITKDFDTESIPIRHIQASDALYGYDKPSITNGCRLGIIMYGLLHEDDMDLKSTFKVFSEIIQIHHLNPDDNVGYEGIYHAKDNEIIAVVAIGYADGIIRKNTGRCVYINNKRYPIIGNICMDLLFVRIDEDINVHDQVIILKDNEHIKETAKHLESIPYEVICSISKRVIRKYIN